MDKLYQSPLIYGKISQVMSEVGVVAKTRKNTQGSGYMFRGIDDMYNALQGSLSKNQVFFAPTVLDQKREERPTKAGGNLIYTILTMKFTFYAVDGSNFETTTVGEAMDSGDKSANKAMSAALKYALVQVFCIPTDEDNDTDNQTHQVAGPQSGGPNGLQPRQPLPLPAKTVIQTARATPNPARGLSSYSGMAEDFPHGQD